MVISFKISTILYVFKYKTSLLESFENVESGELKKFNAETICQAAGFIRWLNDSTFVHCCGQGGRMRACHRAGPGSIPGRDGFSG